jgi:Protein of unknown function (DUF3604)
MLKLLASHKHRSDNPKSPIRNLQSVIVTRLSRRDWIRRSSLAAAAAALNPALQNRAQPRAGDYKTYFGDLHNHNAVGYAQGSLERTFEIARNHLDFFAFTPHGHWHDIGHYENKIEERWIKGFAVTRARWREVIEMARKFDAPGKFVPLVGYEWHSTSLGDYHIIFPDLDAEYAPMDDLREFQKFAKTRGCLLIPHHPANRRGHRGANFAMRDPAVSPLLEIFSEWGNAEHDRGPYPYIRHSHGGRWTRNTLQYLLAEGHRVGVIASSDDHLGYPGAYREGLAAVKATELTRPALFEALRNRRTYAVTGDRIELDFSLAGQVMGREIPYAPERQLKISVSGWDQIDRVELLKNNRVIHRDFPSDRLPGSESWRRPVLIRVEYGWGPWAALGMVQVADWDIRIRLEGGVLEAVHPCFQSGPLEEGRRDRILDRSEQSVRVESFTARRQQLEDVPTKAVVLKARGGPDTKLIVTLASPSKVSLTQSFKELAESGETIFTGDFPRESALVHRLVFAENYQTSYSVADQDRGEQVAWYYLRVVEANGQIAWSSPIWVEARRRP